LATVPARLSPYPNGASVILEIYADRRAFFPSSCFLFLFSCRPPLLFCLPPQFCSITPPMAAGAALTCPQSIAFAENSDLYFPLSPRGERVRVRGESAEISGNQYNFSRMEVFLMFPHLAAMALSLCRPLGFPVTPPGALSVGPGIHDYLSQFPLGLVAREKSALPGSAGGAPPQREISATSPRNWREISV